MVRYGQGNGVYYRRDELGEPFERMSYKRINAITRNALAAGLLRRTKGRVLTARGAWRMAHGGRQRHPAALATRAALRGGVVTERGDDSVGDDSHRDHGPHYDKHRIDPLINRYTLWLPPETIAI
jgi:hypothetical protein